MINDEPSPDEFDSATQTTTQEEEEEAFDQLHRLFEVIDLWQSSDGQEDARTVPPNSSLAADDLAADPFRSPMPPFMESPAQSITFTLFGC